jgi:formyl-CoA transferase
LLGEHTEEILRDVLNLDDAGVEEVQASGAVGTPAREAAE